MAMLLGFPCNPKSVGKTCPKDSKNEMKVLLQLERLIINVRQCHLKPSSAICKSLTLLLPFPLAELLFASLLSISDLSQTNTEQYMLCTNTTDAFFRNRNMPSHKWEKTFKTIDGENGEEIGNGYNVGGGLLNADGFGRFDGGIAERQVYTPPALTPWSTPMSGISTIARTRRSLPSSLSLTPYFPQKLPYSEKAAATAAGVNTTKTHASTPTGAKASDPTTQGPTFTSASSLPSTAQGLSDSQTGMSGSPTHSNTISSSSRGASQPDASTASRSLRHAQVVIAIAVSMGVLLIIVLITLVFWLRCRRRSTGAGARRTNGQANTVSPFTLLDSQTDVPHNPNITGPESDGRSISASTLRRQHLENQLRAAREKMVNIADLERSSASIAAAPQPSGPHRFFRLVSTRGTSQRDSDGSRELTSQLEAARARIHELEAHMNSDWALGLSDEPPPGYTA
ncbi:hypothetical protein C8R44DRAFT_924740 [Mycena epipterygia]|nr:hypothetical protein C8R44DRAFT_924740 [Mycena epipterygia]